LIIAITTTTSKIILTIFSIFVYLNSFAIKRITFFYVGGDRIIGNEELPADVIF
jgi:hypothetical protein